MFWDFITIASTKSSLLANYWIKSISAWGEIRQNASFRVNDPCRFERYVSSSEKERPGRDLNPDLCDAGAVLYPLGYQEACCYVGPCLLTHKKNTNPLKSLQLVNSPRRCSHGVATKPQRERDNTFSLHKSCQSRLWYRPRGTSNLTEFTLTT